MGLTPAFHGDELNDMMAGALAADVGARSVSHLEELNPEGIVRMANAGVFGVLLPTTACVAHRGLDRLGYLVHSGLFLVLFALDIGRVITNDHPP
jgi:imidazolonepropionase